ncbi:MAG: glycosyltransferase, partial [Anaerolineae bacterium]|nr:glycosyltransferase [Anaerolineae bacterium]
MTRVMYITTGLNISGPSLQAILLTAFLREAGYDTRLVVGTLSDGELTMDYAARRYAVEPILLPGLAHSLNPVQVLVSLWRLYRLIRQHRPDVVHTHQTTAGFIGRIAARLAGVPVVLHTMHVHPFHGHYDRLMTLFFIITERIGALFSDSIITLSEKLRRELAERYHITARRRMIVLPSGYDLRAFARSGRQAGHFRRAWHIPAAAPLVGIVGRLMPVKNHALFLEAARLVLAQMPQAHFAIVGDGELRAALEAQAAPLGAQVHFTGWQEDTAAIYSDLNVLVISSLNEGAPVPIIEALAAGCPVVATNVGGVVDLLAGVPGEIVPSGDAAALAAAILRSLTTPYDPEPARHIMLDRYGIDRLVQDLDSL